MASSLLSSLANSDGAASAGKLVPVRECLSHHKHILLKVSKTVAHALPSIEMIAGGDCAADSANLLLRLAPHGEVLREGPGAFNRGLVHTLSSVESVVNTI